MGYLTDNRMSKLCYHGRPTLCSDYRTCDKCHEHIHHATATCKIQMLKNVDEFIAEKTFLKIYGKRSNCSHIQKVGCWRHVAEDVV